MLLGARLAESPGVMGDGLHPNLRCLLKSRAQSWIRAMGGPGTRGLRGIHWFLVPSRAVLSAVTLSAVCCGDRINHWLQTLVGQLHPLTPPPTARADWGRGCPVPGSPIRLTKHLPLHLWLSTAQCSGPSISPGHGTKVWSMGQRPSSCLGGLHGCRGCCCPRVGPHPQSILRPCMGRSGHVHLCRQPLGTRGPSRLLALVQTGQVQAN